MWSGRFRQPLNRIPANWRRTLLMAIICLTGFAADTRAQEATVTFYSHGSYLTSGVPGTKHGMFFGAIYDGAVKLTGFAEGFVEKNNRFITIHLPVGRHEFTATNSKHPGKEAKVPIVLEAGKQYFFRTQNESSGIVLIEWEKARLDQVSCAEAHNEAANARPLKPRHPPTGLAAMRVNIETTPTCQ